MNVDCSLAESFYSKNEQIGKEGGSGEDSESSLSQSDESPGTNISRSGPQERPSQKTSKPSSSQQGAKNSRPKKQRDREPAARPKPKAGVFTNATIVLWWWFPSWAYPWLIWHSQKPSWVDKNAIDCFKHHSFVSLPPLKGKLKRYWSDFFLGHLTFSWTKFWIPES